RRALLALHDIELHRLAFLQALEAVRLNRRMVDEAVLAPVLRRDEAESLVVIEPLDCALGTHEYRRSLCGSRPSGCGIPVPNELTRYGNEKGPGRSAQVLSLPVSGNLAGFSLPRI